MSSMAYALRPIESPIDCVLRGPWRIWRVPVAERWKFMVRAKSPTQTQSFRNIVWLRCYEGRLEQTQTRDATLARHFLSGAA